ncbi:NAD(P)-binding protein [Conchiformibius kuhniae]|uniref:NAD(P)-binding protein n=1 Tax=Conchiformibius kuhniae TaxID=211502 RepID=A0A8T9MTN4_9NEIS
MGRLCHKTVCLVVFWRQGGGGLVYNLVFAVVVLLYFMSVRFTRRRFLGGSAALLAASCTNPAAYRLPESDASALPYYPPSLSGLRGDHDGSQHAAHGVALGGKRHALPEDGGEQCDLLVVGAGISGLTAAYLYRKAKPDAQILILDNHDDFGGHAKRNEFVVDGKTLITYGGSESLDAPESSFSKNAHALLKELGVDYRKFHQYFQKDLYAKQWGLSKGVLFGAASFGQDMVVAGDLNDPTTAAAAIARFPLPEADRAALTELYTRPKDYLRGKSRKQRQYFAEKTDYYAFLRDTVKLPHHALRFLANISSEYWGHAINAVSVGEAAENGYPGTQKLALPVEKAAKEPYIYHFPDGNASIARLLVRKLIPAAASGSTMEDIVTAPFDYAQLDKPEHRVRLRLNSTAVHLENRDGAVAALYVGKDGALKRVSARQCVFAGHAALAARIVPQMPQAQQNAMKSNVKIPMVYAKVALKNARAFKKLGVYSLYAPDAPYCLLQLDDPVNIGSYRHAATPDEPIVLHAVRIATAFDGADARAMYRGGRARLAGQDLAALEAELRGQLAGLYRLAGESLDDVLAGITFNRWSHGYSYEQVPLWDSDEAAARATAQMQKRVGNIVMAGTDVAWKPYLQDAVEQAFRAVAQLAA